MEHKIQVYFIEAGSGCMAEQPAHYRAVAELVNGEMLIRCGDTEEEARKLVQLDLDPREWSRWIRTLARICRLANDNWWRDPLTGDLIERNKGELLALIHSEVSECLEGVRKNLADDHLPWRSMEVCELADVLIRVFDYAGGFDLPIGEAFSEKMRYNAERADHKPENRINQGKQF